MLIHLFYLLVFTYISSILTDFTLVLYSCCCIWQSHFLMLSNIPLCLHIHTLNQLLMVVLAIINSAALNTRGLVPFSICFSSPRYMSKSGTAGSIR